MKCPACNHEAGAYTTAVNYYSKHSNTCDLMYCKNCVCFFKDNIDNNLESDFHFVGVKSYNNPENFSFGYSKRINFLKFIHDFTIQNIHKDFKIQSWLDYGSGMGYLLFHLKDQYTNVMGVEMSADGRDVCKSNAIEAFPSMLELPDNVKFDIISAIDSFYYSLKPKELINSFNKVLNKDGYVVVRISLRTWLIRLNKMLKKTPDDSLRDHFINYSYQSVIMLFKDNGFEVVKHTFKESGKSYYKPTIRILNQIIGWIYVVSFGLINFHTGVTLIFRKQ